MKTTLTVLAVLCLATIANAGIDVVVGPGVAVGGGLMSYTVSLTGTGADYPVAWDGAFTGPMNQVKFGGFMDFPTLDNAVAALGATGAAQDTHFLFLNADVLPAITPAETATTLTGAFSLKAPFNTTRVLAQIVLAAGAKATMTGQAANAGGAKFDTTKVIPEPATLSLLGLGALALRRRK